MDHGTALRYGVGFWPYGLVVGLGALGIRLYGTVGALAHAVGIALYLLAWAVVAVGVATAAVRLAATVDEARARDGTGE